MYAAIPCPKNPRQQHIVATRDFHMKFQDFVSYLNLGMFTFHQFDPSFLAFVYNFYCGYGCQRIDLSLSQFAPTLGISPQPNSFLNWSGNVICHSFILRGIGQDIDRLQVGRTDSWARR